MTANRKPNSKPRAGATTSALQSALAGSLALLGRQDAPASSFRIDWGRENGRTVIAKETPRSLELQAVRWRDLVATVEALDEVACAIHQWRETNTITAGIVGLSALAAHAETLVPALLDHVGTMETLSPTLRASLRQIEARKARKGDAA